MNEHQSLTITANLLMEGIQKNRVHTDAHSKILLSKIITGLKIFEHKHQEIIRNIQHQDNLWLENISSLILK